MPDEYIIEPIGSFDKPSASDTLALDQSVQRDKHFNKPNNIQIIQNLDALNLQEKDIENMKTLLLYAQIPQNTAVVAYLDNNKLDPGGNTVQTRLYNVTYPLSKSIIINPGSPILNQVKHGSEIQLVSNGHSINIPVHYMSRNSSYPQGIIGITTHDTNAPTTSEDIDAMAGGSRLSFRRIWDGFNNAVKSGAVGIGKLLNKGTSKEKAAVLGGVTAGLLSAFMFKNNKLFLIPAVGASAIGALAIWKMGHDESIGFLK